ncbi:hypothetical protein FB451DRAFT_1517416 [Mycena latifolia]|nr:hypothetical protein FB451DRAFT_1517416 [Mycena latifolia]
MSPGYAWTIAALNNAPNLATLCIAPIDISEGGLADILSSIHVPALEDLTIDLRCRLIPGAFDQFLARHPHIRALSLGRDLVALEDGDVASKDCLRTCGTSARRRHFFPTKAGPPRGTKDALRHVRALELASTSPGDAFEALALQLLRLFPALQSLSFSGCANSNRLDAPAFIARVKQACPRMQRVALDGETYG